MDAGLLIAQVGRSGGTKRVPMPKEWHSRMHRVAMHVWEKWSK